MANTIERGDAQSQLSKLNRTANIQLAVIILLTAIVCASIAAALAYSDDALDAFQRWFLTVFLIFFPVIGLGFSVWMILRHYQKLALYANEDDFSWTTMTAEQQRRKLSLEFARLKPENFENDNVPRLYIAIEDLALREIEAENQMPLLRHIVLEGVPFDGVMVKDGVVFCVEVCFLVEPNLPQEKVDLLLDKVDYASKRVRAKVPGIRVQLLLALVTKLDSQNEQKLRTSLTDKFSLTPVDVDVRFLSFDFLQKTFIAQ